MQRLFQTYGLTWTVQFLIMMALWVAFVAKTEMAEIAVGIVAAALAATGEVAIRQSRLLRFKPRPQWFLEMWRLPGYVLEDTVLIFKVLVRRLLLQKEPHSRLQSIRFDAGGHSARSSAQRALAVLFTTIPPNSI